MSEEERISQLEHRNTELEQQLVIAEARIKEAESIAQRATVESHMRIAALEVGIFPSAMYDVVDRALKTGEWKTDSKGRLLRQRDGVADVDIKGNYVTPNAYLKSLKSEAPF